MEKLSLIGLVISLFALIILFTSSKAKKSFQIKILGILLALFAFRFLLYYAKTIGYYHTFPFILVIDQNFFFLDGPLFYLFTIFTIDKTKINFRLIFHFIPFFAISLYSLYSFFSVEGNYLVKVFENCQTLENFEVGFISGLIIWGIILSAIYYLILSLIKIAKYRRLLKDSYSNIDKLNIKWLSYLIVFWVITIVIPYCFYFFNYYFFTVYSLANIIPVSQIILSTFIGISSIRYQNDLNEISKLDLKNKPDSYSRSGLNEEKIETYFQKLDNYLRSQKPYLNSELKLSEISENLEISNNHLSQIINQKYDKNFYELINSLRLEEVKKNLAEQDKTILSIAYECGFNSKTTFNTIFKKEVGLTPSQYRKKIAI